MSKKTHNAIGGTRKQFTRIVTMAVLILVFLAFMFPFIMVLINSLKVKRDIPAVR